MKNILLIMGLCLVTTYVAAMQESSIESKEPFKTKRSSQLIALNKMVVTREAKNSLKDIVSPRAHEANPYVESQQAVATRDRADSWSEDPVPKKYVI